MDLLAFCSDPNAISGCLVDAIPGAGDTIFPERHALTYTGMGVQSARHGTIHFGTQTDNFFARTVKCLKA